MKQYRIIEKIVTYREYYVNADDWQTAEDIVWQRKAVFDHAEEAERSIQWDGDEPDEVQA